MPASGPKETMSKEELTQREQASRKHGAYAMAAHGEKAMDTNQRSRLEELKETVQDRPGVIALMQERAANAVMLVEVLTSYVAKEHKQGTPLDKIPSLRALPAFMNTAQRALRDLLSVIPEDEGALDAARVLEAVKNGQIDE